MPSIGQNAMKVLHILPNERTADILRRAGVPKENIFAFPVLLAESDRSLWEHFIPNNIKQYDRIIVWHGNDANSLLLLALFCTLHVPLWHIDASKHKHLLHKKKVISKKTKFINMITMSEIGIRALYGKTRKVLWWKLFWNKKRWADSLKFPDDLIQCDSKGLYFFGKEPIEALCLWHTDEEYQPMVSILTNIMTHLDLYNEYVSEAYIVNCLRKLTKDGALDMKPLDGAQIKLGTMKDLNYEIKRLTKDTIIIENEKY